MNLKVIPTHTIKKQMNHCVIHYPSGCHPLHRAEMWQIPSLINVEAAAVNIFISAHAPCSKHIQGDFKLYKLNSYLLRQLSMPTPSPFLHQHLLFSPLPPRCSFPSLPHCWNGIWAFGVHMAANESRGLKVSVLFQWFTLGKVWANPLTAWRHTIWYEGWLISDHQLYKHGAREEDSLRGLMQHK